MIHIIKKIIKKTFFTLKKIELKRRHIIIDSNVSFLGANFSIFNKIYKNSNVDHSSLGRYTYIGWNSNLANVNIGSFCSIGPYVEVIYGTHPIGLVSTHPVFYSTRKQCGITFAKEDFFREFNLINNLNVSAIIGNDVWIGYGAKIIEGVTINDGAIVLAGAYVTKDIESYSIVGGVPAKHIKYRFNEEQRTFLLKLKWWEKDISWLEANAADFLDMSNFINKTKNNS